MKVSGSVEQRDKNKEFLAYLYTENGDKKKYGSLVSTMNTQFSLGVDLYPYAESRGIGVRQFQQSVTSGTSPSLFRTVRS